MRLIIYNCILAVASPWARWWLRRHPRYAPLLERFHPVVPDVGEGAIWLHVCSLGEANAAVPLVQQLQVAFAPARILVTTSTLTGRARCEALYGTDSVTWLPFDTRKGTRKFIEALRPRALVLFETELWPNLLAQCHVAGVPIMLANGRLSDKHQRRYERYRWWFGPLIRQIDHACMQEEVFRDRLVALGVAQERVSVLGSMKFDAVRDSVPSRERSRLRREFGLRDENLVLLFASTRPGDEALASACWVTLREERPNLKLVIAPRHLDRLDEIEAPFCEPVVRRTELQAGKDVEGARVLILDTLGELRDVVSLAHVAVIGGSFYEGVNGHNPLEAAALGVPTVFGPFMSNFSLSARVLLEAGGAVQVACTEDLYLALSTLLGDSGRQRQMGTAARRAVLANQGAVARTVAQLKTLLAVREN